jgi:hypothetical protein
LRSWRLIFLISVSWAACLSGPAAALPVFAHRYGLSCQQCHTTVPTLNAFGKYFQRHGFRLPGGRGTFPVTVKTQFVYESGPPTEPPLPKLIVDEVELLSAGSIGRNTSYYLEQYAVDGGLPGQPRDMWVNVDQYAAASDPVGPAFHAKLGEFTLPLPVDPETQRPTLSHYLLYDQAVGKNAFDLFEPGIGADFSFTDDRHGFEAHLDPLEAYVRESGVPVSGVNLMGTLSQAIGSNATAYVYRYQGRQNLEPQNADLFYRQAYGLGYERGKFGAVGIVQSGYDTNANGLGLGARSSGGFLQASWAFSGALATYARYDEIDDPIDGRTIQDTLDLVIRPANRARLTLEGTYSGHQYQLGLGLMFAY